MRVFALVVVTLLLLALITYEHSERVELEHEVARLSTHVGLFEKWNTAIDSDIRAIRSSTNADEGSWWCTSVGHCYRAQGDCAAEAHLEAFSAGEHACERQRTAFCGGLGARICFTELDACDKFVTTMLTSKKTAVEHSIECLGVE